MEHLKNGRLQGGRNGGGNRCCRPGLSGVCEHLL